MSDSIVIYVPQFDQTVDLDEPGRVDYKEKLEHPGDYDKKIKVHVNLQNLRNAFKYKSNSLEESADSLLEESAFALYIQENDIIPAMKSDFTDGNNAKDTNYEDLYSVYQDPSTHENSNEEEHANVTAPTDFLRELAYAVFHHHHMVDLFSNEDEVALAFKEAILDCGYNIEQLPTQALQLSNDQAGDASTDVAGLFFDKIVLDDSNDSYSSSLEEFTATSGLLKLKIKGSGSKITAVHVERRGHGYVSGDSVELISSDDSNKTITLHVSADSLNYINGNLINVMTSSSVSNITSETLTVCGVVKDSNGDAKNINIYAEFEVNDIGAIVSIVPKSFNSGIDGADSIDFSFTHEDTNNSLSCTVSVGVLETFVNGSNLGGQAAQAVLSALLAQKKHRFNDESERDYNLADSNDDDTNHNVGAWHEMPLKENDSLTTIFTVVSHPDQVDVDNKPVQVKRKILVELIAKDLSAQSKDFEHPDDTNNTKSNPDDYHE